MPRFLAALMLLLAVPAGGCVDPSGARGEILADGRQCGGDAGFVNGEPDYGVTYAFSVKNAGQAGLISVTVTVSTSEGEWTREQRIQFAAGEVMKLSYFFAEPTINATNVQCRVRLTPS